MTASKRMPLDRIDCKILSALDHDARAPLSDIARKLKLGRDIVTYRVERLQRDGVLRRFITVVNPLALGYSVFKTYVKLEPKPEKVQATLSALKRHPRLIWLAQCDGAWDLMIGILGRSAHDYYLVESELFQKFGELFSQWETSTLVETHIYHRRYFSGGKPKYLVLGGPPSNYELDQLEVKLLTLLSDNARMPVIQLAEVLDSTPDIVRNRIERLERHGVIGGYRTDINLASIGLTFIKAMISLRHWGPECVQEFETECARTMHATYFIRQVGKFQVELEMEVEGYEHYYQLIDQLKLSAPGMIRDVETAFMREEFYKWSMP